MIMHLKSIDIIAPSFKIPESDLKECINGLLDLKMEFNISHPLFDKKQLCSHTTSKRVNDFKMALKSDSDFIWCLRGGYGALHMLPDLISLKKPKTIKHLIGFSDITILHYLINQKWNWPSLHWKHLNGFLNPDTRKFNHEFFIKSLESIQNNKFVYFKNLKSLNSKAKDLVLLKGKIVGGNLITIQSLIGLKINKPKDKILFLEEIDEPVYKIDRALTQLEYSGWFNELKGVVLGSFTHKNPEIELEIQKYFKTRFLNSKFPVFKGLKAGHIPNQEPLFLNTESEIKKDKSGYILKNKNGFI